MKKNKIVTIGLIVFSVLVLLCIVSSKSPVSKTADTQGAQTAQMQDPSPKIPAEKVEVIYFHSSNRCATCIKAGGFVENTMKGFEAKAAEGKVVYMDVNVEDSTKRDIVEKFQARGSSLFIGTTISGKETIEEETEAWGYLGDENSFKEYLSNKVNGLLGRN